MKSSGNSSAKANSETGAQADRPGPASRLSRKAFALTGRSAALDPRTHAVRGDLADVRLAEQVFAPHYAAPLPTLVQRATSLFADRGLTEMLADLAAGDGFEVLELAGNHAWGLATTCGLAGYVDRAMLDRVPAAESDAA